MCHPKRPRYHHLLPREDKVDLDIGAIDSSAHMFSILDSYTILNGRESQYLKIARLNSLCYDDGDWSNSNHLRDAFLASIPEDIARSLKDDIEVDTTFAETFILFLREQMPASSTFFDDQRSALKVLDIRKFPGINVKNYLKAAKEPIQALYQGKQFKIHDLRTMLTRLSQSTYGIDPTFTNKCVDYVEFLREMDHKHQFSTFEDAIKALKAHIPPLDFKSIFTELENQYILCKKDKMWSPDKLVLPDPAAVPSSFLSSSVPVTTGGIDQAKTDLVKALLSAMKQENQNCYKCGAKDHFANSPKCPKNKYKSRRNNRAKSQPS